jgi:dTDP-4-amino-4,6-dideoxygalactose transaminase
MMSAPASALEARIAGLFGYPEAALFGRARSAVVALLEVLGGARPFVMPSNLCPDLWLAVHRAQAGPIRLAAVDPHTGLAPDEAYVAAMAGCPRPGVVMPAHLYGLVQHYPKTIAYARAHGWFILENDTIATKAAGVPGFGAFGDALLVSFGHAKGIEAGGGGALATGDPVLAAALRQRAQGYAELDAHALEAEARFVLLGRSLRQGPGHAGSERQLLVHAPKACFRFPAALADALDSALDEFPRVLDDRRRRMQLWQRALAPFSQFLHTPAPTCAFPWRLTLRVPRLRDELVRHLRMAGVDAGTNFPPLNDSFPLLLARQCHPGAQQWGREVLNLWLTPAYDAARIAQAERIIEGVFERARAVK